MSIVLDSPSFWGIVGTIVGVILQYVLSLITALLEKGRITVVSLKDNEFALEKVTNQLDETTGLATINDFSLLKLYFKCSLCWNGKNPNGIKRLLIKTCDIKKISFKKIPFIEIPMNHIVYIDTVGQRFSRCPSVPLFSFITFTVETYEFAVQRNSAKYGHLFEGDFLKSKIPKLYAEDINGKKWFLGILNWKTN